MLLQNPLPQYRSSLDASDLTFLDCAAAARVAHYLHVREDDTPTPLAALPALAQRLGIGGLYVKDEGMRLGPGSFKALGGGYAATQLALEWAGRALGRQLSFQELDEPAVRDPIKQMTFVCATDGNHGRSVARIAHRLGAQAHIFVHQGVSAPRIAAMASYGAKIEVHPGSYDDAVEAAKRAADAHNWVLLADTAWAGYERTPSLVMQGYLAVVTEALRVAPKPYTHVFVQVGVGGLAAAIAGHLAIVRADSRPVFIAVEPERAAWLHASVLAAKSVRIASSGATIMAMLECYEPSLVAWRILSRVADAFMTVGEAEAPQAMRILAQPNDGDPAMVAGESGCVGLAGLLRIARSSSDRERLSIQPDSEVLLINTEGATDPDQYSRLIRSTPSLTAG